MRLVTHTGQAAVMAGLAAALLSGGCAMMTPTSERYTPPPMGSTWNVAERNTGSFGADVQYQERRGSATWQGKQVITFASSRGVTSMMSPDGGFMAVAGPDGKPIMSWDPPVGLQYPLAVGRKWTASTRMTLHAVNRAIPFDASCSVDGYEDVTVPAGTFKTFRIGCSNTVGHDEVYWFSPDLGIWVKTSLKRSAASPFGPGTQERQLTSFSK
ncbi:MAG TPA: hypothetical protein VN324_09790 [Quisquiliibacterium sp.]|nr:hypothetical protein [Quisquiliibacterium sp.]